MNEKSKGCKILIIDDEEEICDLLRDFFEDEEFIVECAHDGEEGIQKACDHSQDIILLDIRMPHMGGLEALQRIKRCSQAPVIMVTALTDQEVTEKCMNLGADGFIVKPVDLEHLNEMVLRLAKC